MSERSSGSEAGGAADRVANRLAGLALAAFAAALWLWIIPWQVDAVEYGWMRPRTLPSICAAGLGIAGLALAAFPGGATELTPRRSIRAAVVLALAAAATWAMGRWGFLVAAPALSGVLVIVLRERRWPWVLAAVLGVPGVIWLVVVPLLGRHLP